MAVYKDMYPQHYNLIWIQKAFFNIQGRNRSCDSNCASSIRAWGFGGRLKKSNLISLIAFCHLIFNVILDLNVPKELKITKGCIFNLKIKSFQKAFQSSQDSEVLSCHGSWESKPVFSSHLFCILEWQEHDEEPVVSHHQGLTSTKVLWLTREYKKVRRPTFFLL